MQRWPRRWFGWIGTPGGLSKLRVSSHLPTAQTGDEDVYPRGQCAHTDDADDRRPALAVFENEKADSETPDDDQDGRVGVGGLHALGSGSHAGTCARIFHRFFCSASIW